MRKRKLIEREHILARIRESDSRHRLSKRETFLLVTFMVAAWASILATTMLQVS